MLLDDHGVNISINNLIQTFAALVNLPSLLKASKQLFFSKPKRMNLKGVNKCTTSVLI